MSLRRIVVSTAGVAALCAPLSAQERVCVEEAAGVCLKYQSVEQPAATTPAPQQASPAERSEKALGLSRENRRAIQRGLGDAGHYGGAIDGLFGPGTRRAIASWQRANGLTASGYLTAGAVAALTRAGSNSPRAPRAQANGATAAAAEFGDLISGLRCTSEDYGEPVSIVFRRDGGAAASAIDISVYVTWTFEAGRFCVFNQGRELTCFPIDMPITIANRETVRDHVQSSCTTR